VPDGNKFKMRSTEKGYRPEFAVRIMEGLSQFELKNLVRASGVGTIIRKQWLRRLKYWNRSRVQWKQSSYLNFEISIFWDRQRMRKKKKKYNPYKFD